MWLEVLKTGKVIIKYYKKRTSSSDTRVSTEMQYYIQHKDI